MKLYSTLVSAFLFLFSLNICAQEFVVGYSAGYGKYQMKDMKYLQEKDVRQCNKSIKSENYKSMKTFPAGLFHNAYAGIKFSFHELGMRYDYFSTGGRNHVQDYSGELKRDLTANGNAFGGYYKAHFISIPIGRKVSFSGNVGIATGGIFNDINQHYLFTLEDPKPYPEEEIMINQFEEIDEKKNYQSVNWYIQPSVEVQFTFNKFVSLNLTLGYLFDKQAKIQTVQEDTYVYYDDSSLVIQPGAEYNYGVNWSGLRASVGVAFTFPVKK